jgi:hypothetical protein
MMSTPLRRFRSRTALIWTFAYSTNGSLAQTTVTSERPASFTLGTACRWS